MCIAATHARTAGLLLPISIFLQQCHHAHSEASFRSSGSFGMVLCVSCRISSSKAVTDKEWGQST